MGTDKRQIKHMVERFLQWKLPENFNPDGGISFKKMFNEHTDHPMKHEPVGTNLFDYTQAEQMVRYIVDGLPSAIAPDRAEKLARRIADYFSRSATFRNLMPGEIDDVASLLRREMGRSSGQEGRDER